MSVMGQKCKQYLMSGEAPCTHLAPVTPHTLDTMVTHGQHHSEQWELHLRPSVVPAPPSTGHSSGDTDIILYQGESINN